MAQAAAQQAAREREQPHQQQQQPQQQQQQQQQAYGPPGGFGGPMPPMGMPMMPNGMGNGMHNGMGAPGGMPNGMGYPPGPMGIPPMPPPPMVPQASGGLACTAGHGRRVAWLRKGAALQVVLKSLCVIVCMSNCSISECGTIARMAMMCSCMRMHPAPGPGMPSHLSNVELLHVTNITCAPLASRGHPSAHTWPHRAPAMLCCTAGHLV
jgi:hypothetical protein